MQTLTRTPLQRTALLLSVAFLVAIAGEAFARPVAFARLESGVDWTSAGVSGIGSAGVGQITISGVSGTVQRAFLYWHGIAQGSGATYANAAISFDGNPVTGIAIGDATTNCWGSGSSTAFRADVTAFVPGNGTYSLAGLASASNYDANGASLVVVFDDGDGSNDRDLAFFEGNDSDNTGFPGEDLGWHTVLGPIDYDGTSPVIAQLHVADGQMFSTGSDDGPVVYSTVNGSVTIPDVLGLYEGDSLTSAGSSRAPNGNLWDIHDFDITGAFGGVQGMVDLHVDGQDVGGDCLGLILLLLDLDEGTVPEPPTCNIALIDPNAEPIEGSVSEPVEGISDVGLIFDFNLDLTVDPFVPGDASVDFELTRVDTDFLGVGTLQGVTGGGALCEEDVQIGSFDPDGMIVRVPGRVFRPRIARPTPDTDGVRCVETDDPDDPDFGSLPFTPFPNGEVELEVPLVGDLGPTTVCCEFIDVQGVISAPFCEEILVVEESNDCDPDGDGNIDGIDVSIIFDARGTPASGPDDPRDSNGDGWITINDARECALQCDLKNCEEVISLTSANAPAEVTSNDVSCGGLECEEESACGLIGIELVPVLLAAAFARRRRARC